MISEAFALCVHATSIKMVRNAMANTGLEMNCFALRGQGTEGSYLDRLKKKLFKRSQVLQVSSEISKENLIQAF